MMLSLSPISLTDSSRIVISINRSVMGVYMKHEAEKPSTLSALFSFWAFFKSRAYVQEFAERSAQILLSEVKGGSLTAVATGDIAMKVEDGEIKELSAIFKVYKKAETISVEPNGTKRL